jgi:ABC-type phosphate/phosphonate transport system substrate-binding protein
MHRSFSMFRAAAVLGVCTAAILAIKPAAARGDEQGAPFVNVGVANSFFRDVSPPLVSAIVQPFSLMLEAQTGIPGKLIPGGDAMSVAQELSENKLQLAVFYGIEFAWAKAKYPELRPLMIAVNQQRHLRAYVVVRSDCRCKCFAKLKGTSVALPKGTREHCRVFLERRCCQECGNDAEHAFSKITAPANFEIALDEVVDGGVEAAIIDSVALECYKRRKPGRFARLKVAVESEVFPAGVLAYRPGYLSDDTLRRFREGMINADKSPIGRQLIMLWKLTGFEDVPEDYNGIVDNIVKLYPPPAPPKK